ncbi:MAG TPA: alpha/beta hydrolase-fold protein [Polyangia bacterium]
MKSESPFGPRPWLVLGALISIHVGCANPSAPGRPGGNGLGGSTSTGGMATTSGGTGGTASGGAGGAAMASGGNGAAGGAGGSTASLDAAAVVDGGSDVSASDAGVTGDTKPGPPPPIADGTEYTKNGPYPLPPEAMPQPGVPVGTIMTFNTPRTWRLYVPRQYDPAVPAAFMVFQDGDLYGSRSGTFRTPNVLDNLIAKKELPVMLAAFIPPGGNRSVEYDSLNDTYAKLIVEQILPMVEARYKITKNPEGRGLGGQSSGGIAAFTAAWQMPNQFRRVLSDNGSFTSIRGGNTYPDLIKAAERKPLRVTLLSSTNDINGTSTAPNGWMQGNKNMAAALKEKGYPYIFMLGNGQHYPPVQAASVHPMHLRWLWWDYVPDGT